MVQTVHSVLSPTQYYEYQMGAPPSSNDCGMMDVDTAQTSNESGKLLFTSSVDRYGCTSASPDEAIHYSCGDCNPRDGLDRDSWHVPAASTRSGHKLANGRGRRPQRRGSVTKYSIASAQQVRQSLEALSSENMVMGAGQNQQQPHHHHHHYTRYQRRMSDYSDNDSAAFSLASSTGSHHSIGGRRN